MASTRPSMLQQIEGISSWHGKMEQAPEKSAIDLCQKKVSMQACNVLCELRQRGQLCDATIKAEGIEFPVHRPIMSACSPYFRALFTNGLYETQQKVLEIPGISAKMMEVVIEYAYTRDANVNAENVEELLPVADHLHIIGLVKSCCEFLKANLSVENCIGIRNYARSYFCSQLEKDAMKFLLRNFQEVSEKSNELLALTLEEMIEILSHDELNVKTEEPVFATIIRWIDHSPSTRKEHIFPLLQCIRLCLLSTSYFVEKVRFLTVHVWQKNKSNIGRGLHLSSPRVMSYGYA